MWNYIRFIIYVKNLPEKKQNAIEKYIFDKVHLYTHDISIS